MSTFVPRNAITRPDEQCVVPTCIIIINAYGAFRNVLGPSIKMSPSFWDDIELVTKVRLYIESKHGLSAEDI